MVVHACIDGSTAETIYLTCADNNLAFTVLSLFEGGVAKYGLPLKIRSDHGLENLYAARYMLQHRGTGRESVLTGRSVHCVIMHHFSVTWKMKEYSMLIKKSIFLHYIMFLCHALTEAWRSL